MARKVKTALDALEAANIPVVTLNAPLAGNVNAVTISDTVEQGKISGELLEEVLLASGVFTVIVRVRNPHAPAVTDSQLALLEAALDLVVIILFVLALLWKQGASTDGKAGAGDQKGSV